MDDGESIDPRSSVAPFQLSSEDEGGEDAEKIAQRIREADSASRGRQVSSGVIMPGYTLFSILIKVHYSFRSLTRANY